MLNYLKPGEIKEARFILEQCAENYHYIQSNLLPMSINAQQGAADPVFWTYPEWVLDIHDEFMRLNGENLTAPKPIGHLGSLNAQLRQLADVANAYRRWNREPKQRPWWPYMRPMLGWWRKRFISDAHPVKPRLPPPVPPLYDKATGQLLALARR